MGTSIEGDADFGHLCPEKSRWGTDMGCCYYAHSLPGRPVGEWEALETHLMEVAALARDFAAGFRAGDWGYLAGLWHDLGKFSDGFQNYLREQNGIEPDEDAAGSASGQRPRHAIVGARHSQRAGKSGIILSYCIAGHHGGLNDTEDLGQRLKSEPVIGMPADLPPYAEGALPTVAPVRCSPEPRICAFQLATFTRMLFSCLVDADYLATEGFMDPVKARLRARSFPSMRQLCDAVDRHVRDKQAKATESPVNHRRAEVLRACIASAELAPGLFSLTVPTGGGKTLSSLSLALAHAARHDLRRVIYAIPFTSIIEQNADVFRAALGPLAGSLVEHHSNLDPDPRKVTRESRLAAENWDAPLIVTTNVQFFESLFARRTSQCRKLHRIARSVIVLDEAQSIPVHVLKPCLAVLQELVNNYGCSVVLCTATQPAISRRDDFSIGLEGVREVIPDTAGLYQAMRRVTTRYVGPLTDAELIERLSGHEQALCIVNTRGHAAKLFAAMRGQKRALHLSALMCPQHRSRVIRLIRRRLRAGRPCVVISTQLVEAGVDLDFPAVYRAMAGLDSIAQAAGRCNREGRLPTGDVFIFDPECPIPAGGQRQAVNSTKDVIGRYADLLGLDAVEDYFKLHYWQRSADWDKHEVMECFAQGGQLMKFATAAERFKMIEETGRAVIVPYGRAGRRLKRLLMTTAADKLPPDVFRLAQRLTVQIPQRQWDDLLASKSIALYGPGDSLPVLMNRESYDRMTGLNLSGPGGVEVESLIV